MSEEGKEEKKAIALQDDGFEGYVDEYVNPPEQATTSIVQGTRIKFSNDGRWVDSEDSEIDTSMELIAVKLLRVLQKWSPDNNPLETRILAPNEPWPDIDAMNDACPRSEWRQDFNGNPAGPWQTQRVCYFVQPVSLKKFTYVTGTIGGQRAISELAGNVTWMRKRVNPGALAVVKLESTFMPTRYGGRMAPSITIVRWLGPNDSGGGEPVIATPPPTALPPQGAAAQPPQGAAQGNPATSAAEILPPLKPAKPVRSSKPKSEVSPTAGLKPIERPTVKQDLDDSVPW